MIRLTEIRLPLDHPDEALTRAVAQKLDLPIEQIGNVEVFKRGYDARRRTRIQLIYTVDVTLSLPENTALPEGTSSQESGLEDELLQRFEKDPHVRPTPDTTYRRVTRGPLPGGMPRPVVIGMGPCGLFAGLLLAEMGLRPLIIERGKAVRDRTADTFGLWRKRKLHPESNVQFGEGGAGTFSDGKLYSQVRDTKHQGRKVLTEFVEAGAPPEILYLSKPHIGTFKLVKMLEKMRAKILGLGGEIRFQTRVTDFDIEDGAIRGLWLRDVSGGDSGEGTAQDVAQGDEHLRTDHVVLAVGHSARDTFQVLHQRGVHMIAKPFSIGFRAEHPQSMIDRCRFGSFAGHPLLGAADYRLVHHCKGKGLEGRSVYSFCMCPGGTVVAATSEAGRVVTNGMSQYSRSERNANAAIVVDIQPEKDYPGGPLAGIELQRRLESHAFELGGGTYDAPGQLIGDFLAGKPSTQFGGVKPSYKPGVKLGDLSTALPDFAVAAIREALPAFDKKIKGFARPDALLTGVETRTSSPLRIERGADGQSLNTHGLFPAGEGAGYAGGIMSAAIDGIRAAEAVAKAMGLVSG